MSNEAITGMARDMAREITDSDFFELSEIPLGKGGTRCSDILGLSRDGLDFLERWLQRAYEAGKKAGQ